MQHVVQVVVIKAPDGFGAQLPATELECFFGALACNDVAVVAQNVECFGILRLRVRKEWDLESGSSLMIQTRD